MSNLRDELMKWFQSGHTMKETLFKFKQYIGVGVEVKYMYRCGILYNYPSKEGEFYKLAVQADKEMDIGV